MIVVNKWDLVKNVDPLKYKEMLIKKMSAIRNFPVIFTSCTTRKNILPSLDMILPLYEKIKKRIAPAGLEKVLRDLNNSAEIRNRRLKFEYLRQEGQNQPKFILGIKNVKYTNENLRRYVENFMRSACDFEGMPVKVNFEKRVKK